MKCLLDEVKQKRISRLKTLRQVLKENRFALFLELL